MGTIRVERIILIIRAGGGGWGGKGDYKKSSWKASRDSHPEVSLLETPDSRETPASRETPTESRETAHEMPRPANIPHVW